MREFFLSGTGYQQGPSGGNKPLPTLKTSSVTPPSRVTPLKPSIIKARAEMDMLNADERWQIPEAFDAYGADAYLADITEHVMSNPEYEGYNEQEKRQIIDSFFKNRGKVMPQGMRSIDAGSAPRADVTVTQKKPVGPKDVMANAKAPDYVAQRYAKMTPDAMRTEYLNDVLKRRMGYSSEPMDEQLALFGKSQGMNEGKMNEALSRHYAGVQANNPYAPVPKDQLRDRDQGTANAIRLLSRGLITADQMPRDYVDPRNPKESKPFGESYDVDAEGNMRSTGYQRYMDWSEKSGFYDSRQARLAKAMDDTFQETYDSLNADNATRINAYNHTQDVIRKSLPAVTATRLRNIGAPYAANFSPQQPSVPDITPKPSMRLRNDPVLAFPLNRKVDAFDANERSLATGVPGTVRGTIGPTLIPMPQANPSDPRLSGVRTRTQSPSTMVTDYDFVGSDLLSPARRTLSEVEGRRNADDFLSTRALINKRFK